MWHLFEARGDSAPFPGAAGISLSDSPRNGRETAAWSSISKGDATVGAVVQTLNLDQNPETAKTESGASEC